MDLDEIMKQHNREYFRKWRKKKKEDPEWVAKEKERKKVWNARRKIKRREDPEWRERQNANARRRYHARKAEKAEK